MIKLITIIFFAILSWVCLFAIANAVAEIAICTNKAIKRFIKKIKEK